MNNSFMPRIRGKVGQIEDGPSEIKGMYAFHIEIVQMGSNDVIWEGEFTDDKYLSKTKEEALRKLRFECQNVQRCLCEVVPEMLPDTYIDMKTNETRKWDEN
jgi:hypothetical protein